MNSFYYVFLLMLLTAPLLGQTGNLWSKTDDFGAGQRARAVGFAINGRGYISCGLDTADQVRNDLWQFDPASATWTQKANLPGAPRRNAVAFVIDDFAYVGTGVDNVDAPLGNILNDFWKYDPMTNSWSAIADYPGVGNGGVYFATAFAIDGKGYVCGGKRGPDNYISSLYEYKPSVNQWSLRGDFPGGARYQLASVLGYDRVYIGLGTDEDIHRKDWWEYHPGANSWKEKTDLPGAGRANVVTFTLAGRPHVGLGSDGGYKDDLWEYIPASDSWQIRRNFPPSGRKYASCFVLANRAYIGLGKAASGSKRSFYVYLPYEPN